MVSEKEMRQSDGKNISLKCKNGKFIVGYAIFQAPQDDEEENMIEIKEYLINQSEIERIEIL